MSRSYISSPRRPVSSRDLRVGVVIFQHLPLNAAIQQLALHNNRHCHGNKEEPHTSLSQQ